MTNPPLDDLPRYPVHLNAFEVGLLLTSIYENKECVKILDKVVEQLISLVQKFRDEADVEIERIGDTIKMKDKEGNVVTREMYEWEK